LGQCRRNLDVLTLMDGSRGFVWFLLETVRQEGAIRIGGLSRCIHAAGASHEDDEPPNWANYSNAARNSWRNVIIL
jgi:hypothetical protein